VGISASTGQYAFLDLPDAGDNDWAKPSVAPDGRHVAYWLGGDTQGSPNLDVGEPVTGVGVYDPVTGETRTWWTPTEHGLWPERLAWADDEHLVIAFNQFMGGEGDDELAQSSGSFVPLHVWDLTRPEPVAVPGTRGTDIWGVPAGGRMLLSDNAGRDVGLRIIDLADGSRGWRVSFAADVSLSEPSISPDGDRIASVFGNMNPNRVGGRRRARSGWPDQARASDQGSGDG